MWYKTNKKLPFKKILDNVQLNLNVSNPDILNTMDMSKRFVNPNLLFVKYFTLNIFNTWISQSLKIVQSNLR